MYVDWFQLQILLNSNAHLWVVNTAKTRVSATNTTHEW